MKPKIHVLEVDQSKDFFLQKHVYNGGEIFYKKGEGNGAVYTSDCIGRFKEKTWLGWGHFRPMLIHVQGKAFCEKLNLSMPLIEPLSDYERKALVKREMARALSKNQEMKNWMFAAIIVGFAVIVVLQILIMKGVHFG